jgi:hypothetical protein
MIKLKFSLDPKDKTQMLALSAFASTLAGAGIPVALRSNELRPVKELPNNEELEALVKKTEKEEQETEAPKTRKRRTKAEIAAEKAANEEQEDGEQEEENDGEDAEEQDAEEGRVSTAERNGKNITLDDIRAAVAEKKDTHFAKMKAELMDRYGVATTPKLPVEHYAAFFDYVNGLK